MLLPCPHCRRKFTLPEAQIPAGRARIQCPACRGVFVLSLAAASRTAEEITGARDCPVHGSDGELVRGREDRASLGRGFDRERPRFVLFWTLLPACCLLLALAGILLSGPWGDPGVPELGASRGGGGEAPPLSSSVSSRPEVFGQGETAQAEPANAKAPPGLAAGSPIADIYWSASPDPKAPCDALLRLHAECLRTEGHAPCSIYPHWIEYLILETGHNPLCNLEAAFSHAADSLQKEALCAQGHAFLALYYLEKKLLERSQSHLDQAVRKGSRDPWVKLVQAVFHERAFYDDREAIRILEDLVRQRPSFPLALYVLGKAQIRQEEYGEAKDSFQSLKDGARGHVAFWRIRRALHSLEEADSQSVEQAEALLALSRAFSALRDDSMAQDLYRWVLEQMPDRLPRGDRMAAYCELGQIYEKKGDNSSAYEAYRNALQIDPDCPVAREGMRALLPDPSKPS